MCLLDGAKWGSPKHRGISLPRCGARERVRGLVDHLSAADQPSGEGLVVSAAAKAERVLGVFAKWPVPGQVKTRLAAVTSDAWAARIATVFLSDTLNRLDRIDARRLLAFAPAEAEASFADLARGRYDLSP